ncbi:MAG TPA: amino acid adenylation domain-containing protein, partial [Thermoanaerobaculia bacterium]|nr:amino acid adenylation domain-containing protein [Thermoanaerobaculia bacterium]
MTATIAQQALAARIAGLPEEKRRLLERMLRAEQVEISRSLILPRKDAAEPARLSFAQERLWFLDQLEPGSPLYNMPTALRLQGILDVGVLARTLGEVVRRHETLRTSFRETAEGPVQVIAPARPRPLPVVDLAGLPEPRRRAESSRLAAEEALRPFDLSRGPLLRAALLRLGGEDHVALFTLHHVVSDGWSMQVLVEEVGALYGAYLAGLPSPLAPLPVQYADYAAWQRSWLSGETLKAELGYWRTRLAGLPPRLELPTDRPRPAVETRRGAVRGLALDPELSARLADLGRRAGATPFMTLLAAWQALLGRWAGVEDLAVGTPIAGRSREEVERLIGFFVNTLVLRGDLSGGPSFRELLGRVRQASLEAHEHQEVPFERLVEELAPQRSLSHSPLFQVLFALQNVRRQALDLPGMRLSPLASGADVTAQFELSFSLEQAGDRIFGSLTYNTDLFDGATAERMLGHFAALLAQAGEDPDRRLPELDLLSEAERSQLLREWNDTGAAGEGALIHELFERRAAEHPEAPALLWNGETVSYGELDRRAGRLARRLRRLGAGPEVVVGVCLERTPELVVALLAVLKSGGAYLPLDPVYPPERLALMLADSGAAAVVSRADLESRLPGSVPVCRVEEEEIQAAAPEIQVTPDNLAYLIYTSGSTGRPKGVAICHRSAVTLLEWAAEVFAPEDLSRVLAATSVSFDLSVYELFLPLTRGGTVVLADNALALPSLGEAVTLVNTVPSAMAELVRTGGLPATVRTVNLAGEALPRWLVEEIYRTGHVERVYNLYGPSEDTTYSTFARVAAGETSAPSIGRPIRATQAYVVDAELGLQPVGVPGELFLGGAGLARGYLGRPELTAERFVPDPFGTEPGARLYRTGDLARWLAGSNLEFLGRLDHQVKLRGFRIELGEIEAVLEEHAEVAAALVVAREERLVAYVASAGAPETRELRAHLKSRLPEHMVPSVFMVLEALPLTPNGKVDRKALPEPERAVAEGGFLTPRTPVEEMLAGVWCEVLGLERVGVGESFFELGGHSLLATQVMSRVRRLFGVELPLRDLFEAPTVAALAVRIEQARRAERGALAPPIVPVPRTGAARLSFAQQRLWFLDRLEPDSPAYNIPVAL